MITHIFENNNNKKKKHGGVRLGQRWLIESKMSNWPFISCVSVTWVSRWPRPFRRQEAVFSLFVLTGEMNAISDYDQFFHLIVTKIHIGPIFHRHIPSEHSDRKKSFFRLTNQEKVNFIWDLSLSQQHTLVRFGIRCFPPCFTTDINGHLNGLIGETMN